MREYVLENTTVSPEEYDKIMKYREFSEENPSLSTDPKKVLVHSLEMFTLNRPLKLNRLKYGVIKRKKEFTLKGIKFKIFYDCYKDKDLFSLKRYGQCYLMSYQIALRNPFDIVTAVCRSDTNIDFLHTFLLYNKDGEEFAIDYTRNIILRKQDYYNLYDVREVKRIANEDFKKYVKLLEGHSSAIGDKLTLSEILCFPEQIAEFILTKRM